MISQSEISGSSGPPWASSNGTSAPALETLGRLVVEPPAEPPAREGQPSEEPGAPSAPISTAAAVWQGGEGVGKLAPALNAAPANTSGT